MANSITRKEHNRNKQNRKRKNISLHVANPKTHKGTRTFLESSRAFGNSASSNPRTSEPNLKGNRRIRKGNKNKQLSNIRRATKIHLGKKSERENRPDNCNSRKINRLHWLRADKSSKSDFSGVRWSWQDVGYGVWEGIIVDYG